MTNRLTDHEENCREIFLNSLERMLPLSPVSHPCLSQSISDLLDSASTLCYLTRELQITCVIQEKILIRAGSVEVEVDYLFNIVTRVQIVQRSVSTNLARLVRSKLQGT